MKIDITNYEIFLLDYIDGNLDARERRMVERFLAVNPDIANEFENAKGCDPEPIVSPSLDKSALFRSFADIPEITASNFEEFCIAFHEGDLQGDEKQRLKDYLTEHPDQEDLFRLHQELHFQSDPNICYPDKHKLKKAVVIPFRRYLYLSHSAAAAILIGILLYVLLQKNPEEVRQETNGNPIYQEVAFTPIHNSAEDNAYSVTVPESAPQVFMTASGSLTQMAVVDTTKQETPGTIILAKLEPRRINLNQQISEDNSMIEREQYAYQTITNTQHTHAESQPSEKQARIINRETLLITAVKAGIRGYNSLTESDLALNAEQDRQGRITSIQIDGDNFQLQRKFRQRNTYKNENYENN